MEYSADNYGMGYLSAEDSKPFFVVLSGEFIKITGEACALPETIDIQEGTENQLFEKYASEHPRREQALSAWVYLEKIYRLDSLFAVHKTPLNAIEQEKHRLQEEDRAFLAGLDPQTYVSWYLPVRKLVSSVSTIAQYRTEEIPATIAAFRKLDYTDPRFYKSGLLKDVIDSHFWLIENSGRSLDSVYVEMEISIDFMIENLASDENKLNEITDHLFQLLESRSLFKVSEYLAIKALTQNACTLNNELAMQLETYRAMKVGNTAPDIEFTGDILKSGTAINEPEYLSELKSDYYVVIFGASWCPACPVDLRQIALLYPKWKENGVEVVFVSLDTDKNTFFKFTRYFPFISMCDYQKWDTRSARDYYVFATPLMYLLDANREILLRPNSVRHMDSWVDWFLVQDKK
ncbi:MAG: TlpA disulfide reductase family protein [Bacteroidales bacterium]